MSDRNEIELEPPPRRWGCCTRAPDESAADYLARRFCGVVPWRATWRDRHEHDERIARQQRLALDEPRRGRVA